jgi:hypothetical protein
MKIKGIWSNHKKRNPELSKLKFKKNLDLLMFEYLKNN